MRQQNNAARLSLDDVLALCELSRSTLRRLEGAGLFPPAMHANRRGDRYWLRVEVAEWKRVLDSFGFDDDRLRALLAAQAAKRGRQKSHE